MVKVAQSPPARAPDTSGVPKSHPYLKRLGYSGESHSRGQRYLTVKRCSEDDSRIENPNVRIQDASATTGITHEGVAGRPGGIRTHDSRIKSPEL